MSNLLTWYHAVSQGVSTPPPPPPPTFTFRAQARGRSRNRVIFDDSFSPDPAQFTVGGVTYEMFDIGYYTNGREIRVNFDKDPRPALASINTGLHVVNFDDAEVLNRATRFDWSYTGSPWTIGTVYTITLTGK